MVHSKEIDMEFVERFNDWSVRQGDGAEFKLNGKFYHGVINKLSEEGIMFRPFSIDFEYKPGYEQYDLMFIKLEDFDKVELEIFDEYRGCDDSAIGLSGCFEKWRHLWPDENIPVVEMRYEYLKSLEPKQLSLAV